jgi:preprotein translocase subunit SecB
MARNSNGSVASNAYTVYLAMAFGAVAACAAYVAFMCQTQYGTIFKVVGP